MSDDNKSNQACSYCNKNSIYNMKCKCNKYFCRKHFHISKHACTFDFCKESIQNLNTNLKKIETKKIDSI